MPVTKAQYLEWGVFGGTANYYGDLSPDKALLTRSKPAFGAFIRHNWAPTWSTSLRITKATLEGNDADAHDEHQRERNLSFRSPLWSFSVHQIASLGGYHPHQQRYFVPYVSLGLSLIHFNPKTVYQGEWIDLQPLGTEGQGLAAYPERKPYKLWELALPLGFGLRYAFNEHVNFNFNIHYYLAFTDYLDDVSTTYVPARDLTENGELAVALSNRTAEYTGLVADRLNGQRRGNENSIDRFLLTSLSFSYNIYKQTPYPEQRNYKMWKWF